MFEAHSNRIIRTTKTFECSKENSITKMPKKWKNPSVLIIWKNFFFHERAFENSPKRSQNRTFWKKKKAHIVRRKFVMGFCRWFRPRQKCPGDASSRKALSTEKEQKLEVVFFSSEMSTSGFTLPLKTISQQKKKHFLHEHLHWHQLL